MLQNPELHYLDNAATTMVAPEVADVIDKAMREHWANPSSLYGPGARSEEALNAARAALKAAEDRLIAYGLSLAPAGVRATLEGAVQRNAAARAKVLDLAFRLDVSTVRA